jgi:hypothetical protein
MIAFIFLIHAIFLTEVLFLMECQIILATILAPEVIFENGAYYILRIYLPHQNLCETSTLKILA